MSQQLPAIEAQIFENRFHNSVLEYLQQKHRLSLELTFQKLSEQFKGENGCDIPSLLMLMFVHFLQRNILCKTQDALRQPQNLVCCFLRLLLKYFNAGEPAQRLQQDTEEASLR